ncbi:hypothetical protein ACOACQ_13185 [Nocardioides sp. CPCC 206347]|uniref:hypothetical protein n=1 Tax=unclassified Nocardioides TaxID=2615069 RepID=UPI00362124F5
MSFTLTAAATVSADPAPLDEDRSPATAVFPFSADHDQTRFEVGAAIGDDIGEVIGEVICRGALAVQALEQLHAGQRILVTGALAPRPSLDRTPDVNGVILVIEATHIGISLTATTAE